jgi:hypothetical protein
MAAWIALAGIALLAIVCVPALAVSLRRRRAAQLTRELLAGEGNREVIRQIRVHSGALLSEEQAFRKMASAVVGAIPATDEEMSVSHSAKSADRITGLIEVMSQNAEAWSEPLGPEASGAEHSGSDDGDLMVALDMVDAPSDVRAAGGATAADLAPATPLSGESIEALAGPSTETGHPAMATGGGASAPVPKLTVILASLGRMIAGPASEDLREATAAARRTVGTVTERLMNTAAHATDRARLRSEIHALLLDADQTTLGAKDAFTLTDARYPERISQAIARFAADGEQALVDAKREYLASIGHPPESTSGWSEVAAVAREFANARREYSDAVKSFVTAARTKGRGRHLATLDVGAAVRILDEVNEEAVSCLADLDAANPAVLLALTERSLPGSAFWGPARKYDKACARAAAQLREIASRHSRAFVIWGSSAAQAFRRTMEQFETSAEAMSARLAAECDSAWSVLADTGSALRQAALRLLVDAPDSSEVQARLAASATCTVLMREISASALPQLAEELIPQPAVFRAIRSTDDHGQLSLVCEQVLELIHRASTLEELASRISPQPAGPELSERYAFEELVRVAGPPPKVYATVGGVYDLMLGADTDPEALGRARRLATWVTHELDSPAGAHVSSGPSATDLGQLALEDAWRPVMAALRGWADVPDVHGADRAGLESVMRALGLTAGESSLQGISGYERAIASQPEADRLLLQSFVTAASAALEGAWARFRSSLAAAPTLSADQIQELRKLEQDLQTSAGAYLGCCRSLLDTTPGSLPGASRAEGDRQALRHRLTEAGNLLTDVDRQLDASELVRAAMALAAAPLPVAPGWMASDQYQLACERLADGLRNIAVDLRQRLSGWAAGVAASLSAQASDFRQYLAGEVDRVGHERAKCWDRVMSAARALQRDVACALLTPSRNDDPGTPVRAAIAVGVIDEIATTNVDALIRDLIPPPQDTGRSQEVADQLMAAEALERRYQTAAVVLAGADGILLGALAAEGLGGWSQAVHGLSGIAVDLHAASSDLLTYLRSPGFAHQAHSVGPEFVKYLFANVAPNKSDINIHTDSLMHVISSAHESYSHVVNTLLVQLATSDDELGLVAGKYVLHDVTHVAGQFASAARHAPSIEDALRHTEHAGQLVGLELVHGVVAHVPIATGVLATVREMRLRREHEISALSTLGNIALDTAVVGGSVAAALAVTAPLHVGPHAIISIPAAALFAYFGRKQLTKHRIAKLEQLQAEAKAAYTTFDSARAVMVTEFCSSLGGEMTKTRTDFLRKIRTRPPSILNEKDRTGRLAAALRSATTAYLDRLQALTRELHNAPADAGAKAVNLTSLNAVIRKAQHATAESESFIKGNDLAGAMLAVSAASLPQCRGWGPSDLYEQAYADVARKLTHLEDTRRADVGKWIADSLGAFAAVKPPLDRWLTEANASLRTKYAAALAPFEAAEKTFNVEYARLGGR